MGRLLCLALGVSLVVPAAALAAPPPRPPPALADLPPPPPPPPAAAVDCFPACRTGFFCYQGQCRSACNPPCAAGEQCLESGQCVRGSTSPPADAPLAGRDERTGGDQPARGYHFEQERISGLLVAGPVLFGVGYIISVFYGVFGYLIANLSPPGASGFLYQNRGAFLIYAVPLAGPLLSQFVLSRSFGYRDGFGRSFEFLFAGVVTGLQAVGLGLAIPGIFIKRQVEVRDRFTAAPVEPPFRLSFAPMAPGAPMGFSLLLEH